MCALMYSTGKRGPAETGIIRRIHFTYERATRKFKADLELWLGWIDFCKQSHSTKQISKVCEWSAHSRQLCSLDPKVHV